MNTTSIAVASLSVFFAAVVTVEPAVGAAATAPSIPCSGVWKLNEAMTHRTRSVLGPYYQFFEPWGKDGWMRMNTGALDMPQSAAEWHFELLNNQPYQVFGADPSLGKARKITDHIVEATRVREGEEANTQYVVFAENCSKVTFFKAEGEDRHGEPGRTHFYNDIRVFDRIEPPTGPVLAVGDVFGGWMLDRRASTLTIAPMHPETIVIVPWGRTGWIWNRISGGPYQPEDLRNNVQRVECGASQGATARACEGPPRNMMLYWASWDAKTFPAYGTTARKVQLKRVNAQNFELNLLSAAATPVPVAKSTVAFSPNGQRLTVTTTSAAAGAKPDIRVYERIRAETWPTVKP